MEENIKEESSQAEKCSSSLTCYGAWIDVDKECPAIGQKVILFAKGVVQEEIYMYDMDGNDYTTESFWSRDDLEEHPLVKSGQMWMPLPKAP